MSLKLYKFEQNVLWKKKINTFLSVMVMLRQNSPKSQTCPVYKIKCFFTVVSVQDIFNLPM